MSCPGVDVAAWHNKNQAPLYPGKMNRWIVLRTLRDEPDPDFLKSSLAAVFVKWFDGSWFDPLLTFDGTTRSGAADLIKLVNASQDRLLLSPATATREKLPYGTLPTIAPGPVIFLEVEFAYRGFAKTMPWPTYKREGIVQTQETSGCPVGADWVLDRVGAPIADAPKEKTTTEKLTTFVSSGLDRVLGIVVVASLGVLAFHFATKGKD